MGQAEGIEAHNAVENLETAQLNVLQDRLLLSSDLRAQLVEKLEQERVRSWREAFTARGFMRKIDKLIPPDSKAMQARLQTQSEAYYACYAAGLLPGGSPPPRLGGTP